MMLCLILLTLILSSAGNAKNESYVFKRKNILLVDTNTGTPVKDEKIIVYHNYEYVCLTDGIRPTKCTDGSQTTLDVTNGKIELMPQTIEKIHLTGRKPQVEIQVPGLCEDQEWHPGYCRILISLKDFNSASDPMTVMIPFKTQNAPRAPTRPSAGR